MKSQFRILLLPGLGDSGPSHWQTHWQAAHPEFQRVVQDDWETPVAEEWVARLHRYIAADTSPALLVAHSLACNLVIRWAMQHSGPVVAAMLVAPSDVEAPSYPAGTTGFTPMLLHRLPFSSLVVASTDDDYVSTERARCFADAWGSEYLQLENRGHIGSAANLGMWPEGMAILQRLVQGLGPCPQSR